MPSYQSLPNNSFFPDPFLFMNGTRMTTKAEWSCRRQEIATLAQEFEYGYKPNPPTSATTGSRSGNTLTVTVNDNGRTISFNASITLSEHGHRAVSRHHRGRRVQPEQLGALQHGRRRHQPAE